MSRKDAKRCQLIKMVIEFAQQISIYCTDTPQNTPANDNLLCELNKHFL